MSTYNVPEIPRSEGGIAWSASMEASPESTVVLPPVPFEGDLAEARHAIHSPCHPIFLALSAINVWTDRTTAHYYALSTALCLCVCAVGNGVAWICPNAAAAVIAPSLTSHSRSRWGGDPQCPPTGQCARACRGTKS